MPRVHKIMTTNFNLYTKQRMKAEVFTLSTLHSVFDQAFSTDLRSRWVLCSAFFNHPLQFWSTLSNDDLVLLHQSFKSFPWIPCCSQASTARHYQVLYWFIFLFFIMYCASLLICLDPQKMYDCKKRWKQNLMVIILLMKPNWHNSWDFFVWWLRNSQ